MFNKVHVCKSDCVKYSNTFNFSCNKFFFKVLTQNATVTVKKIFQNLHQDIKYFLSEIENKAVEAEAILVRKMSAYKKQLQLFYVDLVDHRPPIPTEVERG